MSFLFSFVNIIFYIFWSNTNSRRQRNELKIQLRIKGQKLTIWAEGEPNLKEFLIWNRGRIYKDAGYTSHCFIRWAKWQRYSRFGVIAD
jgi:hypothetical protein